MKPGCARSRCILSVASIRTPRPMEVGIARRRRELPTGRAIIPSTILPSHRAERCAAQRIQLKREIRLSKLLIFIYLSVRFSGKSFLLGDG